MQWKERRKSLPKTIMAKKVASLFPNRLILTHVFITISRLRIWLALWQRYPRKFFINYVWCPA
ncbi:hypothetical protein ELS82_17245 [Vibrio ouci]|uniref:Uncharacterized protein n=1 Tax=Vibrio ouci TaxID=2499078 RepID=A0A4Y8WCU9_9VIBR|nr:hypothetical protein ELS82_17245 [Vibrio ouci]